MSVADLCREYGISRPTVYRWINRYNETGPEGLGDRSLRPHSCSHATVEPIENAILVLRAKHPSWGARKLKATARRGLACSQYIRQHLEPCGLDQSAEEEKTHHAVLRAVLAGHGSKYPWCMDFKGYFTTGDGKRCDPFAMTDAHSRYLIRCQIASRMDLSQVRAICGASMREYGLPARIRTDNGAVCGHGATGAVEALTRLDEARDRA
jgi:transposase-like protein